MEPISTALAGIALVKQSVDFIKTHINTADYEVLTELNFFAVQLRYDDELVMEDPDWPLCFALLERLLLQIEGRCSGS